jgi:serine phosphatase RsbU (regulator of sigma subunit)
MGAELEITRRLQQMVLPKPQELRDIDGLDISGFMEPADEVGGDYYDVLHHAGCVKIGIGDVTGHGLESGVVMLMVQMAVRTLLINGVKDCQQFMNVLNRAVFDNVRRMDSDKNLTLALLDYSAGKIRLTGQHEEVLVIRKGGQVERLDTSDLGFMVGIEPDISNLVNEAEIDLAEGDGVVLYTDGITEARDAQRKMYGVERLCEMVGQHWAESAEGIHKAVVSDVKRHIGEHAKLHDDITILVLKQKAFPPLPEALSKGADQPFVSTGSANG